MDCRHRPLFLHRLIVGVATGALMLSACGGSDEDSSVPEESTAATTSTTSTTAAAEAGEAADERYPDVLDAVSQLDDDGTWSFDVTISSPYDSPEQYADAWRVVGPDGTEYGFRLLTHDHANEQPFTRSQNGITIPDDVTSVTVEGRDLVNGWGGGSLEHELAR